MSNYRVPITVNDHIADLQRRVGELERREVMPNSTDTWTIVITGSGSNPTVTYAAQTGTYTRIANIIFFSLPVFISTISGGSGDLRLSLPVTVSQGTEGCVLCGGVDLPGTPATLVFSPADGTTYGHVDTANDNAAFGRLQISSLAAGDFFIIAGFYFV